MNFGKWIVVAFVLFAIFIGSLVALCVREDISLVSKEYYKDELAYQQQLDRLSNTAKLSQKPRIEVRGNELKIVWGSNTKIYNGELKLFCPSNANLDKKFSLRESNEQIFNMTSSTKGHYRAKLLWSADGREYFYEQEIYIL